jgi:hypothetical protein
MLSTKTLGERSHAFLLLRVAFPVVRVSGFSRRDSNDALRKTALATEIRISAAKAAYLVQLFSISAAKAALASRDGEHPEQ